MKCPTNYAPQEDKISNLSIKLDINANPNITNIHFRLTLNGTLRYHVYQSFASM